jgi:hypothetical protein
VSLPVRWLGLVLSQPSDGPFLIINSSSCSTTRAIGDDSPIIVFGDGAGSQSHIQGRPDAALSPTCAIASQAQAALRNS